MYSTSSSRCDCIEPFPFSATIPNFIGNPFCPTTRQPLIYYARIQEPFHQEHRANTKDNPNCFMKAFQWYTQERESGHKNETAGSNVNHSDFAAWLDKKYSEYLKRCQQNGSELILKQSPILQEDKTSKKEKSRKKFGRMRSPWKRRRRTNSKEKGDLPPVNQSIEYILQPQDLQKPASECCQRDSRIQSSTTIISKESLKLTKVKVKSKSLLSIYRAPGVYENKEKTKSHPKHICECRKNDEGTQYETFSLESLTSRNCTKTPRFEEKNTSDVSVIRFSPQKNPRSKVLCECSEVKLYENDAMLLHKHVARQDNDYNKEYIPGVKKQTRDSKMLKTGDIFTEKPGMDTTKLQNYSTQTSDRAINLSNVTYERLLLKVVHVNK